MNEQKYKQYLQILKEELVPAMGCTEPIAIAYAGAKAKEVLGKMPKRCVVKCSGNIIKNARCVTVPNTDGLKGIDASATIGIVAGRSEKELEVISEVEASQISETKKRLEEGFCQVELLDTEVSLHLIVEVYTEEEWASVEIKYAHTNIVKIIKNNEVIFEVEETPDKYLGVFIDRAILNVEDIYHFANEVRLEDVEELMALQMEYNMEMAKEGLTGKYGIGIGKVLVDAHPVGCIETKIKAYTAAASEARMSGSPLPVMTNSGSGNQGMTSSIPVIIYAKEKGLSQEALYRGLVFANLITIHQKTLIGRLSAFCGAVSASCASGAAITYLEGGSVEQVAYTITNTLANISGIVCDGAKPSCAAKIASSLDGAMMGHHLAMASQSYEANTGILKESIEETIAAVGRLGRDGMHQTDKEILDIMLGR